MEDLVDEAVREAILDRARQIAASAPPLTAHQRAVIRRCLGPDALPRTSPTRSTSPESDDQMPASG